MQIIGIASSADFHEFRPIDHHLGRAFQQGEQDGNPFPVIFRVQYDSPEALHGTISDLDSLAGVKVLISRNQIHLVAGPAFQFLNQGVTNHDRLIAKADDADNLRSIAHRPIMNRKVKVAKKVTGK